MAMKQMTLAAAADLTAGFERFRKPTRRDAFLVEMQTLVPRAELVALIEPHYPKPGNGRPPIGLERMLRIHLLQHWFNLADAACEEALYDSAALRGFAGIDLGREPVPDATTILKFRHLLERHELGRAIFAEVGRILQQRGLKLSAGTIVNATIIAAPSSTKNAGQQRDPEMKQTRKGNQWHFGMKVHVGADSKTGLVHSAVVTSANVHDKHPLADLLRGDEKRVYGDRGYQGCGEIIKAAAPEARDFTNRRVRQPWGEDEAERLRNRTKSRTRARVEHPFLVLKRVWGFAKVRYRGLAKNANRTFTALAMVNLYIAARRVPALVRPY
jgi:IS5 family transposase